MSKSLKISSTLSLPLDAVTQTFAIIGRKGSGKTNTSVVMSEEMLSQPFQVVILDPLDVWHGLRSSADGKEAGFPIIVIGGEHADLPLHSGSGEILADFVVEHRASVILSTRHLSGNEQRQFVAAFGKRLYHLKGKSENRTPMHLIIDEADEFVPQRLRPDQLGCFGAIDTIVRRGRASGIGVTLISQRPAVINKDCLTQVECMITLQLTSPQDRKALEAWVEAHDIEGKHDEFMASLARLPVGAAWIWSPSWLNKFELVQIRRRETFDSSATPKFGEKVVVPKQIAPVDIESLKTKLAATIEQKKADDPRELRKQIAELKAQIAKKAQVSGPSFDELQVIREQAEIAGWNQACYVITKDLMPQLGEHMKSWQAGVFLAMREKKCTKLPKGHMKPKGYNGPSDPNANGDREPAPNILPVSRKPLIDLERMPKGTKSFALTGYADGSHSVELDGHRLGRCELAILKALAQYPQGRTKAQAAVLSGYAVNSGGFNNALSTLRSTGAIEGGGGCMKITQRGLTALGDDFERLPTGHDLFIHWTSGNKLGRCEREILRHLYNARMECDKEWLSNATGYAANSGGFNNALSKLRTLELIYGPGSAMKAADIFYEG